MTRPPSGSAAGVDTGDRCAGDPPTTVVAVLAATTALIPSWSTVARWQAVSSRQQANNEEILIGGTPKGSSPFYSNDAKKT
ncbi:hypothetical protein MMG85_04725 [Pseudoxanthomonas sp. LH2527]|uniref:hypothetical protein n=1 Tax=Pseudoxanthomonas sp. LH2527 TaxID=2923249 RepID=UPI001F13B25D|nr:hypothetical protein [Pseudoxanthomonas sp. LH2527]MCH6482868.1 hypothetical protein [Pseudoxanthomonas sp. LH2527]